MTNEVTEIQKKLREQYDNFPYPNIPLEQSPKEEYDLLFSNNFLTAYYLRNQKVLQNEGKVILDAGCGSGYKTLVLAESNPGAKLVGIDISEESVKLARRRLAYYGFENVDFYAIAIEDLPKLGLKFDYINVDEVLYLLPNPVESLRILKSVLNPEGIIRANLHSYLQRFSYFQAQEIFKMMGLMDTPPGEFEAELVRETMTALKDQVPLKRQIWNTSYEKDTQWILVNPLLQADRGYTIPELFSILKAANLEFISMLKWRHWEVMDLFKEPDNLPVFLGMALPDLAIEEQLHLFELLHPIHRLLDFWCGHPNQARPVIPVAEWTLSDWQKARLYLHPQLRTARVTEDLMDCIAKQHPFEISRYLPATTKTPITIESSMAACLLPLWKQEQSVAVMSVVERWLKIRPFHPATLEPVEEKTAFNEVKKLLSHLEVFLYVLLELPV